MTPKEFFDKYKAPHKKKGWPDDMASGIISWYDTMEEWWNECRNPRQMVLVLKTMNYAEEIWSFAIMKWGLECRDYYKREKASKKCCDRIRNRIPAIGWK